jgi:hypothetical protein
MNRTKASVMLTTIYLFSYAAVINLDLPPLFVAIAGIIWPFTFIWMIYCILKDKHFEYPELADGQEWGYRDKESHELGLF